MTDEFTTFGEWVRRRRKALDLTQAGLARRAGCAVVTIQKIESGERRPSRQVAERLADSLSLAHAERPIFLLSARGERPAARLPQPGSPPALPPHNLPAQPNAFVGRQALLASARSLLAAHRLVTLTGPGGTGKTRLALELARELVPSFRHGVCFVSLGPLSDAGHVARAIADALGVRFSGPGGPAESLQRYLRGRQVLLVLDNFEHLLPAAPLVRDLLDAAAQLTILATSREALGVYGEQELPVPPLALPAGFRPELWTLLPQVDSAALFIQRAQAARPGFRLEAQNAEDVAEICLRLDGLPLAIELAAARLKAFTPHELRQRLASRLDWLTGGPRDAPARQQTLRRTIEWSLGLLARPERNLFSALAVFAGSFGLEAAEAVCGNSKAIVNGLAALVARNLLRAEAAGQETRYSWLETIRDYALEQLAARPDAAALRRRHLAYFTAWAEAGEPVLFGAGQPAWLDRASLEHENFNAALAWSLASSAAEEVELGQRLAGVLGWYWHFRGHWDAGRQWLSLLLARPASAPAVLARAYQAAGLLAWAQEAYPEARASLETAEKLLPAQPPSLTRAHTLGLLGLVRLYQLETAAARPLFEASLKVFEAMGDEFGRGVSNIRLGIAARLQGDWDNAVRASQTSLEIFHRLGNPWGIATSWANLAEAALARGDWPEAARCYTEALAHMRLTGSDWYLGLLMAGVASVAAARGEPELAARVFGAADSVVASAGGHLPALDRLMYDQGLAQVRAALDPDAFDQARAEGHAAAPAEWEVWIDSALEAG